MTNRPLSIAVLSVLLVPTLLCAQDGEIEAKGIINKARALKTANPTQTAGPIVPPIAFDSLPFFAAHSRAPYVIDKAGAQENADNALTNICKAQSAAGKLIGQKIALVNGENAHAFQLCQRAEVKDGLLYNLIIAKDTYVVRKELARTNARTSLAKMCDEMGIEAGLVGELFELYDGAAANAIQICRYKKPY
ncbi:MAG: hypothetical protein Q8T11_09305 [Elusimicrobiota bacterium]|nr:hypothetical protein [Elusimicrobiota bacterium]